MIRRKIRKKEVKKEKTRKGKMSMKRMKVLKEKERFSMKTLDQLLHLLRV